MNFNQNMSLSSTHNFPKENTNVFADQVNVNPRNTFNSQTLQNFNQNSTSINMNSNVFPINIPKQPQRQYNSNSHTLSDFSNTFNAHKKQFSYNTPQNPHMNHLDRNSNPNPVASSFLNKFHPNMKRGLVQNNVPSHENNPRVFNDRNSHQINNFKRSENIANQKNFVSKPQGSHSQNFSRIQPRPPLLRSYSSGEGINAGNDGLADLLGGLNALVQNEQSTNFSNLNRLNSLDSESLGENSNPMGLNNLLQSIAILKVLSNPETLSMTLNMLSGLQGSTDQEKTVPKSEIPVEDEISSTNNNNDNQVNNDIKDKVVRDEKNEGLASSLKEKGKKIISANPIESKKNEKNYQHLEDDEFKQSIRLEKGRSPNFRDDIDNLSIKIKGSHENKSPKRIEITTKSDIKFEHNLGTLLNTVPNMLEEKANSPVPPKKKLLDFFEDSVGLGTSTRETEKHQRCYKVLGQDKNLKTQERNLLEKLDTFFGEKKIDNQHEDNDKKEEEEEKKTIKESPEKDEFNYESRYFIQNPIQVCHRCKKSGHYEKWCIEEIVLKCGFCVGGHKMNNCPQIVCFSCLKTGHRIKDCPSPSKEFCYRCGKKGHKSYKCGVMNSKDQKLTTYEKEENLQRIKCILCSQEGHYNCGFRRINTENCYLDDLYKGEIQGTQEQMIEEIEEKEDIGEENMNIDTNQQGFDNKEISQENHHNTDMEA